MLIEHDNFKKWTEEIELCILYFIKELILILPTPKLPWKIKYSTLTGHVTIYDNSSLQTLIFSYLSTTVGDLKQLSYSTCLPGIQPTASQHYLWTPHSVPQHTVNGEVESSHYDYMTASAHTTQDAYSAMVTAKTSVHSDDQIEIARNMLSQIHTVYSTYCTHTAL